MCAHMCRRRVRCVKQENERRSKNKLHLNLKGPNLNVYEYTHEYADRIEDNFI